MRVIQANKYWFLKGGAERYVLELTKLLESRGDAVAPFAMHDPRELPTPYARHFVSRVITEETGDAREALRTVGRMLWSFEAQRKFRALAQATKPEVVHAHNIYHQLSPSFLATADAMGIPSVMTLHDHHLISPNYNMTLDGEVVEPSVAHPYLDTLMRRLVDRSLPKSALTAFEGWLHHALHAYDRVRAFVAPSRYLKDMVVKHGIEESRVAIVPHFIDLAGREPVEASKPRVLFVGRLSPEKGADLLVKAMRHLPRFEAVIVGEGPERTRLRAQVADMKLANVRFAGQLQGKELEREYKDARAVVIPSVCPETFGLTALEAYAWGKPVIAADIGGLPEVVRTGETGRLFPPGHVAHLAADIEHLLVDANLSRKMGLAGRRLAETEYAPDVHYHRIREIYERARYR